LQHGNSIGESFNRTLFNCEKLDGRSHIIRGALL
jgi:hypothetical protein